VKILFVWREDLFEHGLGLIFTQHDKLATHWSLPLKSNCDANA